MSNDKKSFNKAEFLENLSAQKNKIITVCLLVGVMGFMWFKVLTGKSQTPAAADAAQTAAQQTKQIALIYHQPTFIQGRNDTLGRDIFCDTDFTGFNGEKTGKNGTVLSDTGETDVQLAAKMLKLDAILSGENPEAFIGDKLVKVSDKIVIEKNGKNYEFTVLNISKSKVQLKYSQTVVELSLADDPAENQ